jgi:hypothetical protein
VIYKKHGDRANQFPDGVPSPRHKPFAFNRSTYQGIPLYLECGACHHKWFGTPEAQEKAMRAIALLVDEVMAVGCKEKKRTIGEAFTDWMEGDIDSDYWDSGDKDARREAFLAGAEAAKEIK